MKEFEKKLISSLFGEDASSSLVYVGLHAYNYVFDSFVTDMFYNKCLNFNVYARWKYILQDLLSKCDMEKFSYRPSKVVFHYAVVR